MPKFAFSDAAIRAIERPPVSHRIDYDDGPVRGLALQTTPAGRKTFLLVYVAKASGRERRLVIGEFGPAPKLSLTAARRRATELRALVDLGRDPWLEAKEARAAAEIAAVKTKATLGSLLEAYAESLRQAGKPSAQEVADSAERNLKEPFPKIAQLEAGQVTVDDLMPVLRRLTKAGKWRAAEKLTSYLRSAFNAAVGARTDAGAHAFDGFDLRINPIQALKVKRPAEGADRDLGDVDQKGALSEVELRHYWRAIRKIDTPQGAMLRFHLLSGGQRMEQLSRLTVRDINLETETVTLEDTKGRRAKARKHIVPLLPEAIDAIREMRTTTPGGDYLFTVSGGKNAAVPHTLAAAMREVSGLLVDREEVSMAVTPGTIRRTVETRLAAAGVSREDRAQLQSHGLGGIQARHYDRHDYVDEKRRALIVLREMLEFRVKVAPIESAKRAAR